MTLLTHSTPRRLLLAVSAAPLLLGGIGALPAQAAPSRPEVPAGPRCDPATSYSLAASEGWSWYAYDSGTIANSSSKATLHKSVSHSTSESRSTTKSGEVGLSISAWVATINAKYGYSVSKTVSYTTTQTFTVDVPPKTTVKYKDGIIVRKFKVKIVRTTSDCRSSTSYGHVYAADNRSEVKDA